DDTQNDRNPQNPAVGAGEAFFHGWIDWRLVRRRLKVLLIVIRWRRHVSLLDWMIPRMSSAKPAMQPTKSPARVIQEVPSQRSSRWPITSPTTIAAGRTNARLL